MRELEFLIKKVCRVRPPLWAGLSQEEPLEVLAVSMTARLSDKADVFYGALVRPVADGVYSPRRTWCRVQELVFEDEAVRHRLLGLQLATK